MGSWGQAKISLSSKMRSRLTLVARLRRGTKHLEAQKRKRQGFANNFQELLSAAFSAVIAKEPTK
jgi:hypothetical protein